MDDSAIRNYCTWARNELRDEVMRRCAIYGIAEKPAAPADADAVGGRVLTDVEKRQRRELLEEVGRDGLDRTVERAAYTWFNRIAAIRFMEVNDRLPSRTRLLSANDGSFRPQALQEPLSVDIEGLDRAEVARLVQEGDDEATFRCLLLAQCHELSSCMPDVFERVGAAMELLLPDGLLREGGVVERMVDAIPEPDWAEGVEIVGWMYQYYNQERKDEYFASKRKATADDIAPATQLFTPEWIVRYLVENSLGRLWMLNFPESRLKDSMEYYIDPGDEHEENFLRIGSPEDITFCDPCCGSGHILVYAFDLLARMYEEQGYSRREIPRLVLERNLTGIEIDRRAGQLASFALAMKACEYDRRFLSRGVRPSITVLEPVRFGDGELAGTDLLAEGHDLLDAFAHLDEVGSLYVPAEGDLALVEDAIEAKGDPADMFAAHIVAELETMKSELELLIRRFSTVVTNPPYLGNFNPWMSKWVKENYPDEKGDLFAAFINRNRRFAEQFGELGFMTPFVWMFISSYEKLRKELVSGSFITSLIQLEYSGFSGATVPICTFTLCNGSAEDVKGGYIRLSDFPGAVNQAPKALEAIHNHECGWFYRAHQRDFASIPGSPIAYWLSSSFIQCFSGKLMKEYFTSGGRTKTHNNALYVRKWWEVPFSSIGVRWRSYANGGGYRKWYGLLDDVVDWSDSAVQEYDSHGGLPNMDGVASLGICWGLITSSETSFREKLPDQPYSSGSPTIIPDSEIPYQVVLGFLNSSIVREALSALNPTLNTTVGDVMSLPYPNVADSAEITQMVDENIAITRQDWDSDETSWNFTQHPMLSRRLVCEAYKKWNDDCRSRFNTLKSNEEKINDIFIQSLSLRDKISCEVSAEKVSVRLADLHDGMCTLISYAVGCMMGRYSLDADGLVLADQGATLRDYLEKVPSPTFTPDEDGIIPLTDVEYFHDDATGLFVDFLKAAYGEETLEENLAFVAESLGGEGTPREVIRDYFRNRFFVNHCKTYQKRPIYWLFDSGRKGGFRALFYMHRYTPDLLAKLRTDYVHPQQERYRNRIERIDEVLPTADRSEAARLKKERKKLSDQLAETNAYEERVHHLADQMTRIDLDDGVKHNYALFQDVLAKIK
jgi:hypothetical protein